MPETVVLGVFEIRSLIGEGGMGEVWHGFHIEQGVEVAIKVLREHQAEKQKIRDAFMREVQSVAKLSHPGIIRVFDYGVVDRAAMLASKGRLPQDSPYFAMELATRGSLATLKGVMTWKQLRWLLMETLNALAHAHARDLIHRDLKPDNMLMTVDERERTCLKLTDFGIVHVADPDVSTATHDLQTLFAGTPQYMAPEQLRGKWRDFGPWTDLYSLGCVAYEQSSGRLPFDGTNIFEVAHQQMASDPPPLRPRMPVPEGFEAWVARLMAKHPQDRFRRAADAAWALMQLGEPLALADDSPSVILPIAERGARSFELREANVMLESDPEHTGESSLHTELAVLLEHRSLLDVTRHKQTPSLYSDTPLLPVSWQRRNPAPPSMQLVGAGLGLFGLREAPFVGRVIERDVLWTQLGRVHDEVSAMGVVIRGATGVGKSRLGEWIVRRAHEVGGSIVMRTSHAPQEAPTSGIGRMVARHLGCVGLPREKVYARIREVLGESDFFQSTLELDALALTELIIPGHTEPLEDEGPSIQLATPRERTIVVARLLTHLCQERPVLLLLDDAHLSMDTLACVELLMTGAATRSLPLMFVICVNDDQICEEAAAALDRLAATDRAPELTLRPLSDGELTEMLRTIIRLEDSLERIVLELARGNPTFATQLIGDWVQRDILEIHAHGYFGLRGDAEAFTPATLPQLWDTRIQHLCRTILSQERGDARFGTIEQVRAPLEIAAALGQSVFHHEWKLACQLAGVAIPSSALEIMAAQGFAVLDRKHWSFSQDAIRQRLEQTSREAGRWAAQNMACASMIDQLFDRTHPGAPARLIQFLIEAEQHALALEPMHYLVDRYAMRTEFDRAAVVLDELDEVFFRLALAPGDARRGRYLQQRARHTVHMAGGLPAAREQLRDALDRAEFQGWDDTIGELLLVRAEHALLAGELALSGESSKAAAERFADRGQESLLARCFATLCIQRTLTGEHKQAMGYIKTALELYQQLDQSSELIQDHAAQAYLALGMLYCARNKPDKATSTLKHASRRFDELGDRMRQINATLLLGDLARHREDFAVAEKFVRDAIAVAAEFAPHPITWIAQVHLLHVLIERGEFGEALELVAPLDAQLQENGLRLWEPSLLLGASVVFAAHRQIEDWAAMFSRVEATLTARPMIWPDLGRAADLCGDILARIGHDAEAIRVWTVALEQWRTLGRAEAARATNHRMNLAGDRLPRGRG